MKEFKQWHEEDNVTFHNQSMVYFSDCGKNRTMGLEKILKITSDVAVAEFSTKGLTPQKLLEHNFAILVSRVAYRFHKLPGENQEITLSTWEEKSQPLQFMRQYEITDTNTKEPLVTGYSAWLLVDLQARRILPVKKFDLREPVEYQKGHDCMEPGKITIPEQMELWDERTIRHSDLDSNGHTNNSRYGAFIEDALPAEYADRAFVDFRINFSKEALLGDSIKVYGAINEEERKITVVGKTQTDTSFESELYW